MRLKVARDTQGSKVERRVRRLTDSSQYGMDGGMWKRNEVDLVYQRDSTHGEN
jgi:hypothetical protein